MTSRAQQVLRDALALPVEERADVAAELLASLDDAPQEDQAQVEAAWAREIERRARRVMSGESAGEPWEDVRARVVRRLTEPNQLRMPECYSNAFGQHDFGSVQPHRRWCETAKRHTEVRRLRGEALAG